MLATLSTARLPQTARQQQQQQQRGGRQSLRCMAAKGGGGGREASSSKRASGGSKRGGGGSKAGKARGGGGGSGSKAPQQGKRGAAAEGLPPLVPPLQAPVLAALSAAERMPAPLWSTFCGVSNGLWCGITAAYSPYTGQPEPLALDEAGKPLSLLHQCCVEQRLLGEDGQDAVVRHVARAASPEGLRREMVQGGQLLFPACAADGAADGALSECWDEEALVCGQPGLVTFDGGSYSAGPAAIGTPPDLQRPAAIPFDDAAAADAAARLEAALAAPPAVDSLELVGQSDEEDAEAAGCGEEEEAAAAGPDVAAMAADEQPEFDWTTAVIEHCMQWGGEQRLRVRLTLDTAGGGDGSELEVQPLRVAVSREAWEGLPGSFTPDQQGAGAAEQQEASRQVRLDAGMLRGDWKVFEVTAVTVDDVSMETGLPSQSTLYTAHETARAFSCQMGEDGGDGALLLLPHSCGVQLETLRLDNTRRRGLRVATHWCPQPGMLLTTSRLYDAAGRLLEVATSTAIHGDGASGSSTE